MPRPFKRIPAPWLQITRGIAKFGRSFQSPERDWVGIKKRAFAASRVPKSKPSFGKPKIKKKPTVITFKKGGFRKGLSKKRKEYITWRMWFGETNLFYDKRGGPRDLSKVKYPNYGQFPKWLGPHVIFNIRPTERFRIELKIRRETHTDVRHIERTTKLFLDELRGNLLVYAKMIIEKYVPKDSGDLQKAMLKSLKDCRRNGYSLKMVLAAPIDYAGVVNKMPERKVRHDTKMGKRSRKTGKLLHDPLAQKTYFTYIEMNLKDKARDLIYIMITKMVLMWSRGIQIKIQPKVYMPQKPTMTKARQRGIWGKKIPFKAETSGLNIADPVYEDRLRYSRRAKMWQKAQTTPTPRIAYPFGRDLIKGFFKIDGLYKK